MSPEPIEFYSDKAIETAGRIVDSDWDSDERARQGESYGVLAERIAAAIDGASLRERRRFIEVLYPIFNSAAASGGEGLTYITPEQFAALRDLLEGK